jgi:hypothetical protein
MKVRQRYDIGYVVRRNFKKRPKYFDKLIPNSCAVFWQQRQGKASPQSAQPHSHDCWCKSRWTFRSKSFCSTSTSTSTYACSTVLESLFLFSYFSSYYYYAYLLHSFLCPALGRVSTNQLRGLNDELNCNVCRLYCKLVRACFRDHREIVLTALLCLSFSWTVPPTLQHKRSRPKSMRASHGEARHGGAPSLPSSLSLAAALLVVSPVVPAGEFVNTDVAVTSEAPNARMAVSSRRGGWDHW